MLYTGIDMHKRTTVLATVDEAGRVVREASVPSSRSAVARYFAELPAASLATVEATSCWYWLRDLLEREGVPLTLAHAKFVKAIAYAKVKTDAVDALTLAQLHRADLIPRAHMVSPELRPLRDLLRTRLQLVEKRVSAKRTQSVLRRTRRNSLSFAPAPEHPRLESGDELRVDPRQRPATIVAPPGRQLQPMIPALHRHNGDVSARGRRRHFPEQPRILQCRHDGIIQAVRREDGDSQLTYHRDWIDFGVRPPPAEVLEARGPMQPLDPGLRRDVRIRTD